MSDPLTIEYYKSKKCLPDFKNGLEMLSYIVMEVTAKDERSCDHQKAQNKKDRMKKKVSKKKQPKKESSSSKDEEEKGKSVDEMTNQEWISCIMRHKTKTNEGQKGNDPSSNNEPSLSSMPKEFQREITEKCGGSTPNRLFRVIKKSVTKTDVSKSHCRLSLPCNQLNGFEFLEDNEVTLVRNKQVIQVLLTHKPRDDNGEPLPLAETVLNFGQWNLHIKLDDPRRQSPQYVLRSGWNNIVSQDQRKENTPIEVWAFRDVENRLCMALVELAP